MPNFCEIVFVEAKSSNGGKRGAFFLGKMLITSAAAMARRFAAPLRGVILVGQIALGLGQVRCLAV